MNKYYFHKQRIFFYLQTLAEVSHSQSHCTCW